MNSSGRASVSVVIPCYCCAETIDQAVDSVIAQTMFPKQVILIDDASPDDGATFRKLHALQKKYADKLKVEVIHLKVNGGPSAARNAGWEAATQPYVVFLDADDSWLSRKLEIQYGWMVLHPEVSVCGHSITRESVECKEGENNFDKSVPINKYAILFRNVFPTSSVMLRKNIALRFDENKRYIEDYDLWLRAFFEGLELVRLDVVLGCNYKGVYGESGLSANMWQMERGELDCYIKLTSEGYITRLEMLLYLSWSIFRFFRRCAYKAIN